MATVVQVSESVSRVDRAARPVSPLFDDFSMTQQTIAFGEQLEIGTGVIFSLIGAGKLIGRGYYQLAQRTKDSPPSYHQPVMVEEVLEFLLVDRSGVYVDCTIGGGGHAEALLRRLDSSAFLIGLDRDAEAIAASSGRLAPWQSQILLQKAAFADVEKVVHEAGFTAVDGILFDLGVSSHQIDADYRGFSFMKDGPLDMRMDQDQSYGAFQVLHRSTELELRKIFQEYGEERRAAAIAREIVRYRQQARIESTSTLARIVSQVAHPAHLNKTLARVFQALRIYVNNELNQLRSGLGAALKLLRPGGRLVVLSYHSLEDRIVKQFFLSHEKRCVCPPEFPQCVCGEKGELKVLTRGSRGPSQAEVARNPRARSARLRAAEKIESV